MAPTFKDKVCIVTGARSTGDELGIGAAVSVRFAELGAHVIVVDADGDGAEKLSLRIREAGGSATAFGVDVSSEAEVASLVDRVLAATGRIDVLHNNAAIAPLDDMDVASMSVETWDRVLGVNLRGPMLGCKHVVPVMLKQGGGSIINTSSAAALLGNTVRAAYAASKAALNNLTRHVATAYGRAGVRCNAVSPGLVLTPHAREVMSDAANTMMRKQTILPRLGVSADIVSAVVFLASDDASFITGQIISVDGGLNAHQPYSFGA